MLKKAAVVFNGSELPNNINYRFMVRQFPFLRFMIGPTLLIGLGIWGILLLIYARRMFRKEGLLLLFVAAYVLPLCLFMPLGRYKLVLYPALAVLAALAWPICRAWWEQHQQKALISAGLLLFCSMTIAWPRHEVVRSTDYATWAVALLSMPDKTQQEQALGYLEQAYQINPRSEAAALNLAAELFRRGRVADAAHIGTTYLCDNPNHPGALYYAGLGALGQGKFNDAEKYLGAIRPDTLSPSREVLKDFYMGEAIRLQKRPDEARIYYQRALKRENNPARRQLIERSLSQCGE